MNLLGPKFLHPWTFFLPAFLLVKIMAGTKAFFPLVLSLKKSFSRGYKNVVYKNIFFFIFINFYWRGINFDEFF